MEQKKETKKRRIGLIITLAINVLIVGFIAFSEFKPGSQEVEEVSVADIKLIFLLLGVLCFGVAVLADYLKYRRMLMLTEGRFDRRGALECALIGKYYDNVTPFGAGGQPFQIHYLKKRGYSSGTSAAAPAMGFLTQQVAFVIAGAVVFIANRRVLRFAPLINYTAYVGLLMYLLLPLAIVLFAVTPKPFRAFVRWIVRIGGKLRLIKDVDATCEKWLAGIDEYIECIRLFAKHPLVLVKLMFFSLLYQAAILSIPFFMLRAFGGSGDWWTAFSLVVYIYAAITIIPTPGNAGAAEGSFYAVFSSLEGGMLFWAMIAWRLLVYYSWLVCGLIIIARGTVQRGVRRFTPPPAKGPLKVALFTDIYYPAVDGVVRTVDAYARHLKGMGHEAFVVYPKQTKPHKELPYEYYETGSFNLPGFAFSVPTGRATRELKERFRNDPPDVIHVHSPFFTGRLALKLGRKYRIPVVATFHSKYYDDALNVTHSRLLAKIFVDFVVNFFNRADIVWACSRMTAQTLRTYGYNGEIYVMENGIERSEIPDLINVIRGGSAERFHLPRGNRGLLFVGQMIWQKDLKLILDTVKLLENDAPDYFLVLAGTGYNENDIKAYAHKLGLDNKVRFVGKIVSREQLFGLYLDADLFFFPSKYDNAPLVLREAAAAGLPALLTEGSNAAEVVEDGVNGYTAEPTPEAMAERIRAAFAKGDIRAVGEKAKKTIPIDWDEIIGRAVTAYRTCSREGHIDMIKNVFAE
ncbi:MAG: flippase-like domain-containing protein [Clostridia bacterium]|nr:flippase-like domain-containing protein [Clostridia bacterium]